MSLQGGAAEAELTHSQGPTKNAAETVQPAADTETAAVDREGETLAEAANASRFDDGHGFESTCAPQEHHEEGQALRKDKPSGDEPCQSHRSTSTKSFRRSVASVPEVHQVCQTHTGSREIQA